MRRKKTSDGKMGKRKKETERKKNTLTQKQQLPFGKMNTNDIERQSRVNQLYL